jgi:hypothetical protein
MNLARTQIEIDAVESDGAGEALADPHKFE